MTWITSELGQPLLTEDSQNFLITEAAMPLAEIVPSYPYQQYADDYNIVAWFEAYNSVAQAYLDWFNQTGLAIYISPYISGPLLDWIGNGIYGVPRPVFSTLSTSYRPAVLNGVPLNTVGINSSSKTQSGTAILANDDYYKRVLTWCTYIGDGRNTSIPVIRKRIARFVYGANGQDVSLSLAQNIGIVVHTTPTVSLAITIPTSTAAAYFKEAFLAGILPFPFQLVATITLV